MRLAGRVSRVEALACFALLAALPWLGLRFAPAGLVVGAFAYRALRRARRGLLALAGVEIVAFATAVYVGANGRLYGGPSPYSADNGPLRRTGTLDKLYIRGHYYSDKPYVVSFLMAGLYRGCRWLGLPAQLVHKRPAERRCNQHFGAARLSMPPRILAGLVDIEVVMRVLDERNAHAASGELGDEPLDQRRLAAPRPAGEAEQTHLRTGPVVLTHGEGDCPSSARFAAATSAAKPR